MVIYDNTKRGGHKVIKKSLKLYPLNLITQWLTYKMEKAGIKELVPYFKRQRADFNPNVTMLFPLLLNMS